MFKPRISILIIFLVLAAWSTIYTTQVRPWFMRWGATDAELAMSFPGDAYIPPQTVGSTRAITIHAPADAIWPWIVQLGQGRGGYYSFDWLENLFAAEMHNAEQIVPEWQQVKEGDHISFQNNGPYMVVAYVDEGRALAMEGGWAWYLEPIDEHTTRLIVRYASFPVNNTLSRLFYYPIFEPAHFVMEQGMMLGIAHRAERFFHSNLATATPIEKWQDEYAATIH